MEDSKEVISKDWNGNGLEFYIECGGRVIKRTHPEKQQAKELEKIS